METARVEQLESTPGFVIRDVPDAEHCVGPTRLGARLIPGNATMLVRHQTYVFATLGQRRSGATIGLKSEPADATAAVAALADELADDFASQRLLTSPGLRLDAAALAPVLTHDRRNPIAGDDRDGITFGDELVGVGAAAAAAALVGGLESKRVAIEGFGAEGLAIARAVAAQGATVARVAAGGACVSDGGSSAGEGLTPAVLADAWLAHGDDCVAALGEADGVATEKPSQVWSDDVDVIFCGSKPAALTGEDAKTAGTTAVVSWSPAAISSRALAVLRSAGAPAAADFVAALGPTLTWWADPTTTHEALRAETAETVASVMAETAGHDDGAVMAACYRAERFMETWIDELPFGRPLG